MNEALCALRNPEHDSRIRISRPVLESLSAFRARELFPREGCPGENHVDPAGELAVIGAGLTVAVLLVKIGRLCHPQLHVLIQNI